MNLIDKDALKKDVLDLPNCYNGFSDTFDKACIIGLIDEQPTIEERKKGKWMVSYLEHEAMGIRPKLLYCSECCQCIAYSTNFCPNCGARMQEGEDNEKA